MTILSESSVSQTWLEGGQAAEDLLHQRSIDISHETARFRWYKFGPMVVSEIQKRRIEGMQSSRCCWYLDGALVKINGESHYLWRGVDHEGEGG